MHMWPGKIISLFFLHYKRLVLSQLCWSNEFWISNCTLVTLASQNTIYIQNSPLDFLSNVVNIIYKYVAILSSFDEIVECGEKLIKIGKINWNLLKSFLAEIPSKEEMLAWHAAVSDSRYTLTEIDFLIKYLKSLSPLTLYPFRRLLSSASIL